jgi:integrase
MGDIVRLFRKGRFIGWYVRFRDVDGRRKMRASHQPTKALARSFLVQIEARVARDLIGMPAPAAPAPTVEILVEKYLDEYSRPRIKDLTAYRRDCRTALRRALPLFGNVPADRITPREVEKLRTTLGKRYAAGSVRLTLAFLGAVFNWAAAQGLVPSNPLRGIERPTAVSLCEYLPQEEVRALIDLLQARAESGGSVDRWRRACICLALHTGLRKGEVLGLRWCDVDLTTRRLTIARSYDTTPKSGRPRHLWLPEASVPMLAAWKKECPRSAPDLVFPIGRSSPRGAKKDAMFGLPRLLADAGCRPLKRPWHALRHTFASHFIMQGGNILTLQKILGHSDLKMTLVYAHLCPDYLQREMSRLKF